MVILIGYEICLLGIISQRIGFLKLDYGFYQWAWLAIAIDIYR